MEFASKFTYFAGEDSSSESEVEEDLLENALEANLESEDDDSDDGVEDAKAEEESARQVAPKAGFFSFLSRRSSAAPKKKNRKKKVVLESSRPRRVVRHHKADANVCCVKLSTLSKDSDDIFAGDAINCTSCKAVLNKYSQLKQRSDDDQKDLMDVDNPEGEVTWVCEFCGHANDIDLDPEEVPKDTTRDYMIAPAPTQSSDEKDKSEGLVIFAIDTSGSMCVTKEVPGIIAMKGARKDDGFGQLQADDVRPGKQRNTWVSRLQCVQAAVDQQLQDWKAQKPNKKVGLVTFNNEVTIIGDGSSDQKVVAGDKLNDREQLQTIGDAHTVTNPISESCDRLSEKLFSLQETGPTALGPALLISVAMASKTPGSQVVLCTDGLANVGLGALDVAENEREAVEGWYEEVGNLARLYGVTVSVISIAGAECALEDVGRVAEISGGDVTRVEPLDLTKNFTSILQKEVIASQVSATIQLHSGLKFRNEAEDTSSLTRELGNVSEDTEILFEYAVRNRRQLKQQYKDLKAFPFQVRIHYTKPNGMKCLRVISQTRDITNDRNVAEADVRMDILSANCMQQSARMAERGDYQSSRTHNVLYGRFLKKHANNKQERGMYGQWLSGMAQLDESVKQQSCLSAPGAPKSKKAAKKVRKDQDYSMMRAAMSSNSRAFSKQG